MKKVEDKETRMSENRVESAENSGGCDSKEGAISNEAAAGRTIFRFARHSDGRVNRAQAPSVEFVSAADIAAAAASISVHSVVRSEVVPVPTDGHTMVTLPGDDDEDEDEQPAKYMRLA
jgi:hypothetical protein